MINNRFKKGIESLRGIALSAQEKEAMRERLAAVTGMSAAPIRSPWKIRLAAWAEKPSMYVVTASLIASIGSGTLAYAAEGSLPGDLLYPLKVNVSEPIQAALTFSSGGKVALAAQFVERRLDEEAILASEGKLDPVQKVALDQAIGARMQDLNAAVRRSAPHDQARAADIQAKVAASVSAQPERIQALAHVEAHIEEKPADKAPRQTQKPAAPKEERHIEKAEKADKIQNVIKSVLPAATERTDAKAPKSSENAGSSRSASSGHSDSERGRSSSESPSGHATGILRKIIPRR